MKKLFLIIAICAMILTSCNNISKSNEITSDENVIDDSKITLNETSKEAESLIENNVDETAASETEQKPQITYDDVDVVLDALQSASSMITSTVDLEKQMWTSIYNKGENDDVTETFAYLYNQSGGNDKGLKLRIAIEEKCDIISASNFDEEVVQLLEKCVEKYCSLYEIVSCAKGSYSSFIESYDMAFEEFVTAYDDTIAYLYEIEYYTE